jgi:Rps23 Pro-64 3,4-dihydroxylase Tpa1-like proline 4-hydroxylase
LRTFAQFDALIPPADLRAAQDYFAGSIRWKYGWPQGTGDPYSHWNVDFLDAGLDNQDDLEDKLRAGADWQPVVRIWDLLKAGPLYGHRLVRCYANAHTFGVEGYIHTDSKRSDNYTAVVYLNPTWKTEWAGELLFFDGAGDVFHAVSPKPGRVVVFSGATPHAARAVSRTCPAVRVNLAFKSRLN